MGLDLKFHVLKNPNVVQGDSSTLPMSVVGFDRQYEVFATLTKIDGYPEPVLKVRDLPQGMFVYMHGEEGLEKRRENPYGEDLVFCYAKDLKGLRLPESTTALNKAAFQFVKALPDDTPIVIEWR